ncbi:carboxymuconolactone decarboxylase family protein [Iamia sp. SCSIO 61187]|nr:carboxymuconolactone decarboxylase family protein [Iamia sp. SCSIO 61187]
MESDPEKRRAGLEKMAEVYGWEVSDGDGDFFGYTVEHLFGEVWQRDALSMRDRRLLLLGLLVGNADHDVVPIQLAAAFGNDELDADQLRELAVFLAHYAGWPAGARLFGQVEKVLADAAKAAARAAEAEGP